MPCPARSKRMERISAARELDGNENSDGAATWVNLPAGDDGGLSLQESTTWRRNKSSLAHLGRRVLIRDPFVELFGAPELLNQIADDEGVPLRAAMSAPLAITMTSKCPSVVRWVDAHVRIVDHHPLRTDQRML